MTILATPIYFDKSHNYRHLWKHTVVSSVMSVGSRKGNVRERSLRLRMRAFEENEYVCFSIFTSISRINEPIPGMFGLF